MAYTTKTIKVSLSYIQEMMTSKEDFDVLAFCLLVQLNLNTPKIYRATMRRLKEVTRLGNDKLKRIIDYCVAHGMITRESNGTLTIHSLNKDDVYLYKFSNKYQKRNRTQKLSFNLTLKDVKDMLRKAVVANKIKEIEGIRETILLTKNPRTLKDYRKGRNLRKRLSVWGENYFISNSKLASTANCSISKLRQIKNQMLQRKEIERGYSNTYVCEEKDFNFEAYKRTIGCGFLFRHEGRVYKHNPNVYSYKGKNICFVPKNNK